MLYTTICFAGFFLIVGYTAFSVLLKIIGLYVVDPDFPKNTDVQPMTDYEIAKLAVEELENWLQNWADTLATAVEKAVESFSEFTKSLGESINEAKTRYDEKTVETSEDTQSVHQITSGHEDI